MQDKIALTIAELVSEQVKQGLKNHVAILEDSVLNAVRSRAVTPSPHVIDTQLVQIQQALAKGQIDVAFQQALSASDLSLVVYVCEKVNPQEVFGLDKCILPQHVTLSLIQQLSADLTRNTELKYMYLQEALLNLSTSHPLTKDHIPAILKELLKQLNNFIMSNSTHKCARNMRMLQMITQSLLKS
ncbi:enhancer of mRNA-decapping protein 4-like isoform X2 [Agrilus planipennis]|uniref:Enhancer of mRNA-decapping protein 4-like isoform X2 n=1 Tax=Agrilus planipennis TaxID=224129 RepID=A0A7F5RCI0_AGRPL|nr:enhancer of mRNA-decapping protein 4-like isoform X2 [Agrilus planipennis]